jgi:hypothetical protein
MASDDWSGEQGVLDMSLAENVAALPQPRGGNYEFARFTASPYFCIASGNNTSKNSVFRIAIITSRRCSAF